MALIKCRECGNQVSTEASACPHCGAPQRAVPPQLPHGETVQEAPTLPQRKSKLGQNVLIGFGILMGASIIGGMAGGGISAEFIIVKAFTYAIIGGIFFGIVKAFKAMK